MVPVAVVVVVVGQKRKLFKIDESFWYFLIKSFEILPIFENILHFLAAGLSLFLFSTAMVVVCEWKYVFHLSSRLKCDKVLK